MLVQSHSARWIPTIIPLLKYVRRNMRYDVDDAYFSTYLFSHHFPFYSTKDDHISPHVFYFTLSDIYVTFFFLSAQRKHVHQYMKKRTYVYMQVRRAKYKMT